MHTHQLSIQVADPANLPDAFNEFEFLISSYYTSGQKLGKQHTVYVDGNTLVCIIPAHEETSLSTENNNYYVTLRIERLEEFCGNKIQVKQLGKALEEQPVCTCAKSDFYLLIADHAAIDSPIKCGTCFDVVPLYKLPAYYEHGYAPILAWETNYQAVDTLQIDGEVGEEWATEQMSNPNSELSIQGRGVCAGIEQKTGINTYYYLHNTKENTAEQELDSVCPACQIPWLLTTPLANGIFPFKCDNCRLISAFSVNLAG
jgi:predicted  nucleic acid-binding Zn ribbon protein